MVLDVGMNAGQSTRAFLKRGFRVVAVEADPALSLRSIKREGVIVLSRAVARQSNVNVSLCVDGPTETHHLLVGSAMRQCRKALVVRSITCKDLIRTHGVPFLMKVDIEGMEIACLDSLLEMPQAELPKFLVFESPTYKCPHDKVTGCVASFIRVVNALEQRGYRDWKRSYWPAQFGHGYVGEEVLDFHRNSHNQTVLTHDWVNASIVSATGCGLGVHAERIGCDFHARHMRSWPGYSVEH